MNSKVEQLALLGGEPIRSKPWILGPHIDDAEKQIFDDLFQSGSFSKYVGSGDKRTLEQLSLPSIGLEKIDDPWHFLGGKFIRRFCADFAKKFDCQYAIPVNSATTGLSVALAALGLSPGDEVIVPAISYSATGNAPLMFGYIPVFVDVDEKRFCIDPKKLEEAITPKTKAILVVHLAGNFADMDKIMGVAAKHNLYVVEDAAQAIGAKYKNKFAGTIGNVGVFSFQQSKNISTGEGGMIVTNDVNVAKKARLIINHGENLLTNDMNEAEIVNVMGFNFRMTEMSAALGIAQLQKLDRVNRLRVDNAKILEQKLGGFPGLEIPFASEEYLKNGIVDVPHLFVMLYDENLISVKRRTFVEALTAEGVPVGTGYQRPMYASPNFLKKLFNGFNGAPWDVNKNDKVIYRNGMCPAAENLVYSKFLWFYNIAYPSTAEDMDDVVRAVEKVMLNIDELAKYEKGNLSGFSSSQGRILS